MKKFLVITFSLTCLILGNFLPASAQIYEVVELPTFTIKNAQISGISGDVVTITYYEGKRKVYDPVIVNPETQILSGTKQVTIKNLKVKQYLTVSGTKQQEQLIASRITVGYAKAKVTKTPVKKVTAPKTVVKKPVVTPKVTVKKPAVTPKTTAKTTPTVQSTIKSKSK